MKYVQLFTEKFVGMRKNVYLCTNRGDKILPQTNNMKLLRQIVILFIVGISLQASAREDCIVVKSGDAASLLDAIAQANEQNADTLSQRVFVMIPNGIYDLGEKVLTPIIGHNIALVGESMEGTVIVNAPKVEKEGIGTTATLLNRGTGTYVQDLTLKNALDYYHSGAAGRAVCWQDKGQHTIFKRVCMLSYQDTYYSHREDCRHYFEDSEIHGTIDFICGAGDVYFNRCLIVTEKRNADGSGCNVIVAPRTSITPFGYVFNECTVRNDMSTFHFARGWHTYPRCAWLHTRIEMPEKLEPTRYDPMGMRTVDSQFFEYHTMDAQGNDITPKSNVVTFVCKGDVRSLETILTDEEASRFALKAIYPDWRPELVTKKLCGQADKLKAKTFRQ